MKCHLIGVFGAYNLDVVQRLRVFVLRILGVLLGVGVTAHDVMRSLLGFSLMKDKYSVKGQRMVTEESSYLEVLFGEELEHVPVSGLLLLELSLDGLDRQQQLILGRFVVRVKLEYGREVVLRQVVLLLTIVGLSSTEQTLLVVWIDGQRFVTVLYHFDEVVYFEVCHGQVQVTGQQQLTALGLKLAIEVVRRSQQLNDALVLLDR